MRHKKTAFFGSVLLFCILVAAVAFKNSHFRGYGGSDWAAWADSLGDHPKTRYAVGFSEQRFEQVKPGMTPSEVVQILGEPLSKQSWDLWGPDRVGESWDYSEPMTNAPYPNYHLRNVVFNPEHKVEFTGRQYYSEAYETGF